MTRFSSSHQQVPVHYVGKRDKSNGLIIYHTNSGVFGTDFTLSGTNTSVVLEQSSPVKTIEVPYVDKTIAQFQRDINVSNLPFRAVALNEAVNLSTGELTTNTSTPNYEGGYFIDLKRHVVRYNEETRIHIGSVSNTSRELPWYPTIDIGTISKKYNGKTYIFSIPEYEDQSWHPIFGRPYKKVSGMAFSISEKKLAVSSTPIYHRDDNISLFTDAGLPIEDIIHDVDEANGYIYLKRELPRSVEIKAEYVYKDITYVYNRINLNPAIEHNPGIAGRYVLIYLKPVEVHPDGIVRKRSVYHKISNSLIDAVLSLPSTNEPVLVLGAFHIRQTNSYKDTNILDTRTRGGGIKNAEYETALNANKNMYSVTDLGFADGVPYPGSSVVIAEIPESIKDVMTVAEIKRRISKHTVLGVDTLLEFE